MQGQTHPEGGYDHEDPTTPSEREMEAVTIDVVFTGNGVRPVLAERT